MIIPSIKNNLYVIQNRYNIVKSGDGGVIHGFVGLIINAPVLKNLLTFDKPNTVRYVDDQYMSLYFFKNNIPIFNSNIEEYIDIFSV